MRSKCDYAQVAAEGARHTPVLVSGGGRRRDVTRMLLAFTWLPTFVIGCPTVAMRMSMGRAAFRGGTISQTNA